MGSKLAYYLSCMSCSLSLSNVLSRSTVNYLIKQKCLKNNNCKICVISSCGQVFQSKDAPDKSTTPEEFIRMTKGITTATAKAVAAGNSVQQEDVIATANLSRKAISDMLTTCKVLIHTGSASSGPSTQIAAIGR